MPETKTLNFDVGTGLHRIDISTEKTEGAEERIAFLGYFLGLLSHHGGQTLNTRLILCGLDRVRENADGSLSLYWSRQPLASDVDAAINCYSVYRKVSSNPQDPLPPVHVYHLSVGQED